MFIEMLRLVIFLFFEYCVMVTLRGVNFLISLDLHVAQ